MIIPTETKLREFVTGKPHLKEKTKGSLSGWKEISAVTQIKKKQ